MPPATDPPADHRVPIADDAVVIAVAPNPIVAHILRSILDEAGIRAMVAGEHAASLLPHWGTAISVSVLVPRHEYDRAAAAINEAVLGAGAPSRCAACGYDLEGLEAQQRCPECGGEYIDLRRRVHLAPRPSDRREPMAQFGAVMGLFVLFGILAAFLATVLWGIWR